MLRRIALMGVFALIVAACASATETTSTTTLTPEPSTTNTATVVVSTSSTLADTTTTSTTLPGEPIDFGPRLGDVLMVVGVSHDDVLNLRAVPGPREDILDTIPPMFDVLIAQGETRDLRVAFWIKVDYSGTLGWVHMSFIGYQGPTNDTTSSVVASLGENPTAEDIAALGLIVAETLSSTDPPSDIVIVVPASVGDLHEITYDVIGLGDDAVLGFRVHVFGELVADGVSLRSVEVTTICGRGTAADGLCP